jgi:hypothetical protein
VTQSWIEYEVTRRLIFLEALLSLLAIEVHTVLGSRGDRLVVNALGLRIPLWR